MTVIKDFSVVFLSILLEATPFLLIGVIVSVLLTVYISDEFLLRLFPKKSFLSLIYALIAGFLFPVCECGNVPVARRLLIKGVEPAPVITFLLAAPVLNPVVILSTLAAFPGQPQILAYRLLFTVIVSLCVGATFFWVRKEDVLREFDATNLDEHGCSCAQDQCQDDPREVAGCVDLAEEQESHHHHDHHEVSSSSCCHDYDDYKVLPGKVRFMKTILLFRDEFFEMFRLLVLGAMIAAAFRTVLPRATIVRLGSGQVTSVITMMVLAFVICTCSNVDAFFALAFASIFSTGSIVAFLVFGPMIDIKTLVLMSGAFKKRSILWIAVLVALLCFFFGLLVNYVLI